MIIAYTMLDPSGNITALVETLVAEADRARVANKIMSLEPACEQVGFLSFQEAFPDTVFVDMAGGEFCGNASMCAALVSGKRTVKCSGNTELMGASSADGLCTLSMKAQPKGITHYVTEQLMEKEAAEAAIRSMAAAKPTCQDEALGIMFLSGNLLKPLVYVPKAGTLFWENSCASGSIAVGVYLYNKSGVPVDKDLIQPGGLINVKVSEEGIRLSEHIELLCKKEIEVEL